MNIHKLPYAQIGAIGHGINERNGFWEVPNTFETAIQLIIDEVSELHDVIRAKTPPSQKLINKETADELLTYAEGLLSEDADIYVPRRDFYKKSYESTCKGRIEEEVADIVIRCYDWLWGKAIHSPDESEVCREYTPKAEVVSELLSITRVLVSGRFPRPNWMLVDDITDVIVICIGLSKRYDFDLKKHIVLKIAYNSLREYKHGKNY